MEFGCYPGCFHALLSLDLPHKCWLSASQVPFHAGFSQILPLLETDRAGSIPGSHFPLVFSEQAARTRLYLDISSKSWGSTGSDLGLCAAAFITLGSVYLPGATCSQILEGPGSSTAWILEELSFSHQTWGCWCQRNVDTLLFLDHCLSIASGHGAASQGFGVTFLRTGASHSCIAFLKIWGDPPPYCGFHLEGGCLVWVIPILGQDFVGRKTCWIGNFEGSSTLCSTGSIIYLPPTFASFPVLG